MTEGSDPVEGFVRSRSLVDVRVELECDGVEGLRSQDGKR